MLHRPAFPVLPKFRGRSESSRPSNHRHPLRSLHAISSCLRAVPPSRKKNGPILFRIQNPAYRAVWRAPGNGSFVHFQPRKSWCLWDSHRTGASLCRYLASCTLKFRRSEEGFFHQALHGLNRPIPTRLHAGRKYPLSILAAPRLFQPGRFATHNRSCRTRPPAFRTSHRNRHTPIRSSFSINSQFGHRLLPIDEASRALPPSKPIGLRLAPLIVRQPAGRLIRLCIFYRKAHNTCR
ncbi:hypothetical protein SDC9_98621 [bioreactor metagenome]|uniref:Uncharacterized protein n=1 Tax=bioreactor metagenome TaxID=1076179 RepID=A0A645AFC7_9ZZZZ